MKNIDFETILDNVETAVAATDLEGKIVYANKSFCSLFTADSEKIVGKKIFEFVQEGSKELAVKDSSYLVRKVDGNEFSCYYLDLADTKMEKVYSDFISTVSHELRTPLTSIRGFADTMLMSYDKLDSAQIQKFMGIIKDQSNRLIKLVENLLSISKIQVRQSNLVYKSVNVKSRVEQVIDMVKNQYPSCSFSLKFSPDVQNILVDENKFQQIMINLIDNAGKYSFDKGEVLISISNSVYKPSFVSITVQDHGIGIEPQNLGRIFDKFARIENHLTRKTQGSGLGLYIVKSLVDKMGGEIRVKSSTQLPNSGTCFELLFPAASYTNQSQMKLKDK